uniref:Uncharacterized protein n=1 Tax=Trichinella nativa TaxID=6335 RepID=A0A0V1KIL8_9BILA
MQWQATESETALFQLLGDPHEVQAHICYKFSVSPDGSRLVFLWYT